MEDEPNYNIPWMNYELYLVGLGVKPTRYPWWQWPSNIDSNLSPWYDILRKLVFYPIFMVGLLVATGSTYLMGDSTGARKVWAVRWKLL